MIKVLIKKGRAYPKIFCDFCGELIDDPTTANVVWKSSVDEGTTEVYHVHVGKCDSSLEAKFSEPLAWDDLGKHVVKILTNLDLISIKENLSEDDDSPYDLSEVILILENIRSLNEYF